MLTLQVGESCNGVIYAGVAGGNRIYAAPTDSGSKTWNNGTAAWTGVIGGAASTTDGLANTNAIVALVNASMPYVAAQTCRALGQKWYLPAPAELQLIYNNRSVGDFAGTLTVTGYHPSIYWASQYQTSNNAHWVQFESGVTSYGNRIDSRRVRCVRRY